jgi:hypothetical protein
MTLYQITDDLLTINQLLEEMVDEEGNPREPTEEEMNYLREQFIMSNSDFEKKTENICKFIKNLKLQAENVKAEKDSYKAELDRLSRRAKAFENRASCVQNVLRYGMERLGETKIKTDLFTANIQNTQMIVDATSTINFDDIPEQYKKVSVELDKVAIKKALKDGLLMQKSGPENYGKLFDAEGNLLPGITAVQGTALVIR